MSSRDRIDSPDEGPVPGLLSTPECIALSDQLALFFERFGFRRNLGRIWAALFLSPSPLSQAQLAEHLGISAGLVSGSLKELTHFEMIHPVDRPGARRVHYEAEIRLLRIVQSILSKRELPAVRALHETVRAARVRLGRPLEGELGAQTAHLADRLRAVEDAARLYAAMARLVTAIAHLPVLAVARAIRLVEGLHLTDWSDERVAPPPVEARS